MSTNAGSLWALGLGRQCRRHQGGEPRKRREPKAWVAVKEPKLNYQIPKKKYSKKTLCHVLCIHTMAIQTEFLKSNEAKAPDAPRSPYTWNLLKVVWPYTIHIKLDTEPASTLPLPGLIQPFHRLPSSRELRFLGGCQPSKLPWLRIL